MLVPLLIAGAELSAWAAMLRVFFRNKRRELLIYGRSQAKSIGIIDRRLQRMAGTPSKCVAWQAEAITRTVRGIANTRAFELVVIGLCNPGSELRRTFSTQKQEVRLFL